MSEKLIDKILEKALQPAEYEIDGQRVNNRSVAELIALEEHLAKKRASRNPLAALRTFRISTQGPER